VEYPLLVFMDYVFKCIRCGACCRWAGYVRLTDGDIDQIAKFLGLGVDEFVDRFTILTDDRECLSLIDQEDGSCIFYRHGNPSQCVIQKVKPEQCTGFPLKWAHKNWENDCGAAKSKKTEQITNVSNK